MAFFTLSIGANAVLAPISLPHTFSGTEVYGYIDVNNDGTSDFRVSFNSESYASGSMWSGHCMIGNNTPKSGLTGSSSSISTANAILAEDVVLPSSPSSMLSDDGGPSFTSILNYGDQIGSTPLAGMSWSSEAIVFDMGGYDAPLSGNYTTGKKSGYLGVKFMAADGLHYAYIPVTIDDENEEGPQVILGNPGVASSPNQAILAGSGAAVPIPLIASLLGFGVIGGGIFMKRKKKQ